MAEIVLVVTPRRQVIPATADDAELLRLLPPGTQFVAKTTKPRNLRHWRKFRKLAATIAENHSTFTNAEGVISMMKIRAGLAKTMISDDGEIFYELESLSFSECDQVKFDRFYKHVLEDLFVYWAPGVPEVKRPDFLQSMLEFSA